MNFNKKYRIIVEDESSLEKRVDISARMYALLFLIFLLLLSGAVIGIIVLATTPMKNGLPGYLKDSERSATEQQHMRLDSLIKVYEMNEAYLHSILYSLDPPEKVPTDSIVSNALSMSADSMIAESREEKLFMENIKERNKYNISYVSPDMARTMRFGSVNKSAVISASTREKSQAEIILPQGGSISSVAEGKVISVASSPKLAGAYEVIIQHPGGFLSKTSRLKNLMVRAGDRIAPGQIIAGGAAASGVKNTFITFELWHDGDPVIPYLYLSEPRDISEKEK